jgi:hypothetical protein
MQSPRSCSATATSKAANGADIIDLLTMHPEERRKVVLLLGELEAAGTAGGDS